MKAASSIDNHRLSTPAMTRLDSIIGNCSRVAARLMGNDFGAYFTSPVFKLLNSCCPERICCRQDDPSSLRCESVGELSDAGRLARAIHAHHKDNLRSLFCFARAVLSSIRLFAEFTLSRSRFFGSLRMTRSEGLRMVTGEGLIMTACCSRLTEKCRWRDA